MAEVKLSSARSWLYSAAFLGLLGFLLMWRLLPGGIAAPSLPGPDLMLALTFAWVLRRPQYAPVFIVAAIFLLADMLLMRPLGLMTLLVVIATEVLRKRAVRAREMPFPLEWTITSVAVIGVAVANLAILSIFLVDTPGLGQILLQAIFTVLIYPIVVFASYLVFGIRRIMPGETDAKGRLR